MRATRELCVSINPLRGERRNARHGEHEENQ
jgi:hypothetical protein